MMLRSSLAIHSLLMVSTTMAQNTIRLQIQSLPVYHPSGSDIYAAGSFNGWNPEDENYKFRHDASGLYSLDLKLEKGVYEYKITRGGWDKAECKKGGEDIPNRVLNTEENASGALVIEEWADRFPPAPRKSTASKNVKIIDTAFLVPQLKRTRRVWIYLPENYGAGAKRFPVIYMHDGQNVFDDATSYSGEWGVDEYLDSLEKDAKTCIVVAVDNGGTKRLNEYCPYNFKLPGIAGGSRSNKGEGNAYVDFLVKTLKPFIDKNYRTLKDKDNTFIAGSSLGGLISFYAVLKHPGIFGAAAVFSPAFWITPKIFDAIKAKGKKVSSKIYFYAGKQEAVTIVAETEKAYEEMKKVSKKSSLQLSVCEEGRHNEADWGKEFPLFYEWMLK